MVIIQSIAVAVAVSIAAAMRAPGLQVTGADPTRPLQAQHPAHVFGLEVIWLLLSI